MSTSERPALDYQDLLARLADVVYAVDVEGRFTYVNPAGARIFGRQAEELMGRHFSVVVDPDSLPDTAEHFRLGMEDPQRNPFFETRIRRPDGQVRELEVHAGSMYRDGELIGRQGVGRDITELRRLQEELAEKTSRLALLDDQQRAAMDVYRRLNLMAGQVAIDPARVERALEAVEGSFRLETARSLGLHEDLEIIRLVADGYSNQEISDRVHLSVHTVKDRVSRIVTKLGARSRAGVAVRATEAGLL
ncbi:PAS domain S-box protein [Nocardiopsis alkaliphila]|uniref:PAS domain S-box protein n=1 Tax=Nocardiopsis alkaliphila TaxID=225762 RepID=UPI000345B7E4|nr:PAS domain S-box protein [Nocardiopsis alkaliphila]